MNRLNSDKGPSHPRWMTYVLLAAALYNLIWGGWVVLRPNDLFDATGIQRPLYPALWQCVGMVVGVYGIGYAIAARAPYRHWPIVLVGLLGKTLGPIGMANQLMTQPIGEPGRFPLSWMWVVVANDLVWWLPFAAILYQTFKAASAPDADSNGQSVADLNKTFKSQLGVSIAELSEQFSVLLVFLRHSGCTFCREALDDLRRQRATIEASGARIVLVHMGDNETSRSFFAAYGLEDVHRISDPECKLYRAYELGRGQLKQLLSLSVFWRGFTCAILNRHGFGKLAGDGFQMPGAFLVRHNQIVKSYRHLTAASRPDYCSVADSISDSSQVSTESS